MKLRAPKLSITRPHKTGARPSVKLATTLKSATKWVRPIAGLATIARRTFDMLKVDIANPIRNCSATMRFMFSRRRPPATKAHVIEIRIQISAEVVRADGHGRPAYDPGV